MSHSTEMSGEWNIQPSAMALIQHFGDADSTEANSNKILRDFYVFLGTGVYGYLPPIDLTVNFE